ncbi:MAG: inorganic phosphate transporter [Verrucomicrobia bacterium]|nr:inorganic phosphate transporter [Verrucomicrobiota bacterium]
MIQLLGGVFLGWSLGANDASNVFGTAVASRMVRFWTAAIVASGFVVLGAVLEGEAGMATYASLTSISLHGAVVTSVAAALAVTIMTVLKLSVSTSQATVGAILGIGFLNQEINLSGLGKVVACWFGTPVGGAIMAIILYQVIGAIHNRMRLNLFQRDIVLRGALIAGGAYAAYALGANNVANVTGVFVGAGLLTVFAAALIGGLSIALGIMTYSRGVMETVGKRLVKLDPFSALIVVLAEAITVHVYSMIGVPVSTSQAVVGGVLGVGIVKGINTIRVRTLRNIVVGWFLTPLIACFLALAINFVSHLKYIPAP